MEALPGAKAAVVAEEKIAKSKDSLHLLFVECHDESDQEEDEEEAKEVGRRHDISAAYRVFSAIAADEELRGAVQRAYPVERCFPDVLPDTDLEPVLQAAFRDLLGQQNEAKAMAKEEVVLRIQCAPKRLERRVVDLVVAGREGPAAAKIRLCPREYEHILFCVQNLGSMYIGFGNRSWNPSLIGSHLAGKNARIDASSSVDATCRAFFKLQQALRRAPLPPPSSSSSGGIIAVDIGAAPGGWTQFLLERTQGAIRHVFAIDPGDVPYAATPAAVGRVTHLALKAEDAINSVAQCLLSGEAGQSQQRIGCVVCDMNAHPAVAVGSLMQFWKRDLCSKGCRVVVCFKRFASRGSAADWAAVRANFRSVLECMSEPGSCKEMHLIANGVDERTIVASLSVPSAERVAAAAAAATAATAAAAAGGDRKAS